MYKNDKYAATEQTLLKNNNIILKNVPAKFYEIPIQNQEESGGETDSKSLSFTRTKKINIWGFFENLNFLKIFDFFDVFFRKIFMYDEKKSFSSRFFLTI